LLPPSLPISNSDISANRPPSLLRGACAACGARVVCHVERGLGGRGRGG
jgi:hypothetical protein